MATHELGPALLAFDLDEAVAAQLMVVFAGLAEERWSRSMVIGEDDAHPSRTSQHVSLAGDDLRGTRLQVRAILDASLRAYNRRFRTGATTTESVNLLRYRPGETYSPHVDSRWNAYRVVSALVYLNPSQYEGGETRFTLFDVDVKPDRPAVVLFPSNYAYIHEARPVITGTKYVLVSWISDLPVGEVPSTSGSGPRATAGPQDERLP